MFLPLSESYWQEQTVPFASDCFLLFSFGPEGKKRAWIPDDKEAYIEVEIKEISGGKVTVETKNKDVSKTILIFGFQRAAIGMGKEAQRKGMRAGGGICEQLISETRQVLT